MLSPSSDTRESMTAVSSDLQNGHFMARATRPSRTGTPRCAPRPAYTGKRRHSARACSRTRATFASSCGASSTSAIRFASCSASSSLKPRVVIAGVPMRMPLVTVGFCGSFGMAFLLTVMCARPEHGLGVLAGDALRAQVDQEQVAVGAAGDDAHAALGSTFAITRALAITCSW